MELTFQFLMIFLTVQRIAELYLSQKNEKWILAQGGFLVAEKNYFFMVLLHSLWIACYLYQAFFNSLEIQFFSFVLGLFLFLLGQILRLVAIFTLKKRWSTRIFIMPNEPIIRHGIYHYLRHPNYVGVVLEILAVPLMIQDFYGMLGFSLANAIILYFRLQKEEAALCR
jgi:methyltransferase